MSSPSRGGGPAAMPKYLRIAAALRHELDRIAHTPDGRLPSERSLAARYQVNRQTIRAALQHLREDGLVVTGRRGTRSVAAAASAAAPGRAPAAAPAPAPAQSWLTLVTVPPSLAALLGMSGGERTLVHHRRERGPAGEALRHAVTYLSPGAVARSPELARYRDRPAVVRDEDLAPLHHWLDRAAADGRIAETLTMTRTTHPPAAVSQACGLTVRRTLHDASGRLLAVTDLAFPTWDRLTFHRDPERSYSVTRTP
ncbi:GntR family transcriptional regulator [Streptomyces sp. NPDC048258]|uniref:GntR family transcriptional regulator n=1 Tax=Streptomyces sp. NPDC048258 TaxID=3365527 RepID=UPI003718E46B